MSDERIPKFRITSVDGNTLAIINEEGIVPTRGSVVSGSLNKLISKIKESELKEREKQSEIDKLEELCKPISDYLRTNYCPHDSIVITDDKIRLVRDEIGIPVDRYCEEEDESCSDSRVSMEEAISNIVSFLSKTKIGYELN